MKEFYLLATLFAFTQFSFATEFKLASFNRYGPAPSMELWLYPENANTLDEIFDVLKFSNNKINVRLIGESSDKTNQELHYFYNEKMPWLKGELKQDFKNVKLQFVDAFKTTTLYKTLKTKFNNEGFIIKNISFEKLSIFNGRTSIPDVYITFIKKA